MSSSATGSQEADVDDGRLVVVAGVTGANVIPTAATTAAGGGSAAGGVTVEPHEYYGTVATLPDEGDDGGLGDDDSGGRDASDSNKDKAPLLGDKDKDRSKNIELAVVYSTDDSEPIPSVTGDGGTKRRTQEDEGPQIEEEEMTVEEYAGVVLAILKPVSITMLIVIIIIRSLNIPGQNTVGGVFVYQETASDSTSMKFLGSLLNAVIFLGMILVTTVIFAH
ncbi:hypothetical protein Pelo_3482 [Pelomyxa schiedti]|nr:hypothetical protein Pelo_3482 [Pelomyxa schiedti]